MEKIIAMQWQQLLRKKIDLKHFFSALFLSMSFVNPTNAGVVTNINDSGPGSLRAVITASTSGEVITFSPSLLSSGSATIVLNSEILMPHVLTINGLINGSDTLYISGNNNSQIFRIYFTGYGYNFTTYLNNLVLINGNGADGGAVSCLNGQMQVNNCVFRNNRAQLGGAINFINTNFEELTVNNSTFEYNTATERGGAIYCGGTFTSAYRTVQVTINNSTIANNTGGWGGGSGVYCIGRLNSSSGNGPGSYVTSHIYINQSTIYNNNGTRSVEALSSHSNDSFLSGRTFITVTNSTIIGNSGALRVDGSDQNYVDITIKSSIIRGAIENAQASGGQHTTIVSGGNNLFSVSSVSGSVASDQLGVSAAAMALNPLGLYGGTTKTMVPGQGSIAINNGSTSLVNAQNGPILGRRDIGAAEQRATFGTHVVTSCGPYTWINGLTYNSSNSTATHTLTNGNSVGNDSIVKLNLTIRPVYNISKSATICPGSSYTFGTQILTTAGNYTEIFNSIHGCDSTVNLTLSVNDNTVPTPNLASLANVTGQCSVTALTAPTATDNCAGIITGTHNVLLPITAQGTTVVTWTYDDGNGNTSTQTQNVVITDNSAPVPNLASLTNVTDECSVTSLTAPTATDNCAGIITGTHTVTLPITTQGTIVVTWTYDDGNGNTSTQTQNVVITDNVAPIPNLASLANVTDECSVTSLTAPTATDNCTGIITGTHNVLLPITTQGTTVVTWTYDDGNGNTSTQTQNVVITDNSAPVPNLISLTNVTDECSVTSLTAPTATDNCVGIITGTHNVTLPITAQGTTVVIWTYDDGNGNTSMQTQNVIITDNSAPVPNLTSLTNVTGQCSVTSLVAPTATDNCAGTITGTHNALLPITGQGTTVVTWTYDDGHGNTFTQAQNVIITDNTAPVPNLANLPVITAQCSVASLTAPIATDNCAGIITGTHNVTLPITAQGTTIVTWTYDDGNGNTFSQTQNVMVTAPVATTSLNGLTITATVSGATYQWVNCGNGNTPIPGATAQSFTATENGTYAVIVTQNGCSATSSCVSISTVELKDLTMNLFRVYPNPNTGFFKIVTDLQTTITITNAAGQLISTQALESGENIIDLTAVESGFYVIRTIDSKGQVFLQRISIVK